MRLVKIDQKQWEEGLNTLRSDYTLFGPIKRGKTELIKELEENQFPDLTIRNTRLSAKDVIYPQSQKMFTYDLDETKAEHHILKTVDVDTSPKIMIAVRPCDAAGFLIAKQNFDSPEYKDPYWCDTFENTIIIGLACNNPRQDCFCTSTDGGPFSTKGLDLLMALDQEHILLKAITDKGEILLEKSGWVGNCDEEEFLALAKEAEQKVTSTIDTDRLAELSAKDLFDAPFWEDIGFACINCGTCTFSCPTCWCFDIQDENAGNKGKRMRNWDSCMSPLFTLEGSGHNPRGVKYQRVRQRFMHKLKYFSDKYNNGIQCVGCGRCIRLCPVNIDIRKVAKTMNEYHP